MEKSQLAWPEARRVRIRDFRASMEIAATSQRGVSAAVSALNPAFLAARSARESITTRPVRARSSSWFLALFCAACGVTSAQEPPASPVEHTQPGAQDDADAGAPEPPPRGDVPVSPEAVMNIEPPEEAPAPADAEPPPPPSKPGKHKPAQPPPPPPPPAPKVQAPPPAAPLVVWATAGWAAALGGAHCGPQGLEGADTAIRIASTLKRSAAVAGFGVAPAGALADHPLLAYAAREQPERLAELLADAGFSVLALGISDLNGPLLREPRLAQALQAHGVTVMASNLLCRGQPFCSDWATAEDPVTIMEREGRRYALLAVLPDDVLARVEPSGGRSLQLVAAADSLAARTEEARRAGAELVIASIDHGADATASVNLANFLAQLPPDNRPELMLSPSSGDNLLFLRPLDVQPAVVGTRSGVLTGVRVTKIPETRDADVFARSVRQDDWNDELAAKLKQLGESYCAARNAPLPGGQLEQPLSHEGFIELAAATARERAGADLALVDPRDYESTFAARKPTRLQRAQVERAVLLDSPLVSANVTLDWLGNLHKTMNPLRPLVLIGESNDSGVNLIAGRIPVTGALYRVVTTAVLARSGRLPNGFDWTPVDGPNATSRSALLAHLEVDDARDPRLRLRDPVYGTQWVWRTDAQVLTNITKVGGAKYDEPALQVNDSIQVGARAVVNLDADAPKFLFENALQIAIDRNFTTKTTAQDLSFLQTTYTYRGLWPEPFFYPHPFIEGYGETQFTKRHLLLRPKIGLRSMVNRVLSLKAFGGLQYEAYGPNEGVTPGLGAEVVLKPWTTPLNGGVLQVEGSVIYFWNSPGDRDQHTLRGQLITSMPLIGPLQFTLSVLGAIRKEPGMAQGQGLGLQAGLRLRFVNRNMSD